MNKFTVLVLVCAFALGACIPAPTTNNSAPTVDVAATVDSIANTAVALTQAAQPSPTTAPASDTPTPPVADASATPTVVANTDTPQPNLTTTPATATSGPGDLITATFTPTAALGLPTLTPTLGILTYGTLPPANRPYTQITLINKSKRQAYISLQVVTDQGYTIIEYPVKGTVKVRIPTGSYTYVVWVGGRQIVGYFNVSKGVEPTLTIFKDKVVIDKGLASYP
jgi:hypothetical protein